MPLGETRKGQIVTDVIVRKPLPDEAATLKRQPKWSCGISDFPWTYDMEETCLILRGECTVTYGDRCASFAAGDLVVFPRGLTCVWHVKQPVEKHYIFR
jgi:uncharacterized protein